MVIHKRENTTKKDLVAGAFEQTKVCLLLFKA
jgi:hypothetical protein